MGLYPPASTIKPLLTVFALSNGYTNWEETILDDGFLDLRKSKEFSMRGERVAMD